jgi:hypothetical protein
MAKSFKPLKPETITARYTGKTPLSHADASALADRGMSIRDADPRSPLHHLIPRKMLKIEASRRALENAHIDINDYAVQICEGEHTAIHTEHYNLLWEIFFYLNKSPSREMILAHMLDMKIRFKITEHIQPYIK